MPRSNEDCPELCPYRDMPEFNSLTVTCSGARIRLDEVHYVSHDGKVLGEIAIIACGAADGPDIRVPTISAQDWTDTTLTLSELMNLHRQGLLPDQIK